MLRPRPHVLADTQMRQGLSRTYAYCFAEFLNEGSPDHLGTFIPTHLCRFAVRATIKTRMRRFSGKPLSF